MNQHNATNDTEVIRSQVNSDQSAVLAWQATPSDLREELLDEDAERWDGMS